MSILSTTNGRYLASPAEKGVGFHIFDSFFAALAAHRTRSELSRLSDRQLADIGVNRADLPVSDELDRVRARIEMHCGTGF
ncbi:MAG: DUF1127 domain-containing protein [Rhizobiales bacterium]|nr:DUF1127 domain-containing protein [Hyphomicrobiales bacterium]